MQNPSSGDEEWQIAQAIALSLQDASTSAGMPIAPAGGNISDVAITEDDELNAALALSMQSQEQLEPVISTVSDVVSLRQLLFGDASPIVEQQWLNQGFALAPPPQPGTETAGSRPFTAGITQEQGGPCAVLAAAQAFMLRRLLFEDHSLEPAQKHVAEGWLDSPRHLENCLQPDGRRATDALLRGLADILWNATTARTVGPPNESSVARIAFVPEADLPFGGGVSELLDRLLLHSVPAHSWLEVYQALSARLAALRSAGGALSFLCSALLSRGLGPFNSERDDASRPLIDPQFGHCSQEGLNLLLLGQVLRARRQLSSHPALRRTHQTMLSSIALGCVALQATSHVFDGERDLGGGLVLRGVPARPPVGFLSVLEAMRYLQVGNYFKQPHFPIWVVASESHYSVLFALSTSVQRSDPLVTIERELEEAFTQYDHEGNGFISAEHLPSVMNALPQFRLPAIEELRSQLDPEGTSMLIWDRFVQVMLPLHPEAVEAARQQQTAAATPVVPSAFELYHYNGLGSAGHAHKRALRVLTVDPSATRGQPLACDGLGAVIQTRWRDATISWEGVEPSIN